VYNFNVLDIKDICVNYVSFGVITTVIIVIINMV
jgi:hypothetical protein